MEKIRVLIADDKVEILNNIKSILERCNNIEIIDVATNGNEEFEKIIMKKPELVFTDSQMPKMTGIEVIEKINNELRIEDKPNFVLVTGDRNYNILKKVYEMNILTIINKPFDEEDILNAIEQYSNLKNNTREEITIKERVIKEKGFISKLINIFNKKKEGKDE